MTELSFKSRLKDRLRLSLPGEEAHLKMMPKIPLNAPFLKPKKEAKRGGVLLLMYPRENKWTIPFMLRPEYDGIHSGQISLPGGKLEPSDKNLKHTALRETEEELGVPGEGIEILGSLSDIHILPSNFLVSPTIGFLDSRPKFNPDPREVAKIIEVSIDSLLDDKIKKERTFESARGFEVVAPYFDIDNHHLWGATSMILSEFLEIYKDL